jgi:hypothetical protein
VTAILDFTKTAAYREQMPRTIEENRDDLIEMGFDPDDEGQFGLLAWMVWHWEGG